MNRHNNVLCLNHCMFQISHKSPTKGNAHNILERPSLGSSYMYWKKQSFRIGETEQGLKIAQWLPLILGPTEDSYEAPSIAMHTHIVEIALEHSNSQRGKGLKIAQWLPLILGPRKTPMRHLQ